MPWAGSLILVSFLLWRASTWSHCHPQHRRLRNSLRPVHHPSRVRVWCCCSRRLHGKWSWPWSRAPHHWERWTRALRRQFRPRAQALPGSCRSSLPWSAGPRGSSRRFGSLRAASWLQFAELRAFQCPIRLCPTVVQVWPLERRTCQFSNRRWLTAGPEVFQ